VLAALDCGPCGVSIVFVGSKTMRSLNRTWLGKDYATDVLSFSYGERIDGADFLGEVVIAPAVAAEHAKQWRTAFEKEMRALLVHGILHLLGYDHEKDGGEMLRLQSRLMAKAGRRHFSPRLCGDFQDEHGLDLF